MRKQLGKSVRFDVFKRDHFTCQYCGAQPPSIVLVVDHIHPVSKGGTNEIENLTTACEPCNQGKKAKLLSSVPIRPDADMLFLRNQQEIAELKRFQKSKTKLLAQQKKVAAFMQDRWVNIANTNWYPSESIILRLLANGSAESVQSALDVTAQKVNGGWVDKDNWYKYVWGVFWRIEREGDL